MKRRNVVASFTELLQKRYYKGGLEKMHLAIQRDRYESIYFGIVMIRVAK